MTRYTKVDPKNPAAVMRHTKTWKAQEKDRTRAELAAVCERLELKFSRKTWETLDKRLGGDGLGELLTELTALEERLVQVVVPEQSALLDSD